MITVVAALIETDGKLLVCQRRRGDSFALMWEFPGGKKNSNETEPEALERELLEELGAKSCIGDELFRVRHQYPQLGVPIELVLFAASVDAGAIRNLAFETMEWRLPADFPGMNFLPADREVIEKLASGELSLPRVNRPTDSC